MLGFFYAQSEYSLLDNAIFLNDLVKKSKEYGYSFIALSDNAMHGAYKFYKLCVNEGIKPIIGLKVNVSEPDKPLLLYAKNYQGYLNLLKISSYVSITKKNYIDYDVLKKYIKGIIAITPGIEGKIESLIVAENYDDAKKAIKFNKVFFEDFYLGLQMQNILGDNISRYIVDFASEQDIKIVPISKTSYLYQEDKMIYDYLRQIDNKEKSDVGNYHLKSLSELNKEFESYPFVFDNLEEIIPNIDFEIKNVSKTLPKFITPDGISSTEYLTQLCTLGLKKRLNGDYSNLSVYEERLKYELSVIKKMGYENYFLIVYDFVKYAKKQKYLVGPGRGSAAGSLVSYTIGITNVDPIKYELLFERFLNPERVTMPDIDMDFPDDKREDVIKYVYNKYGSNHVCHIATFGRFQSRMAIRDIARVMKIKSYKLDEVIKYIDSSLTIKENLNDVNLLRLLSDEEINNLVYVASKIEGLPKHTSTHAAGIIISDDELTNITAIDDGLNGVYQSQFEASDLEALGLLKIDFLGLKNLTTIDKVCHLINKIDINQIPLDDSFTYELLSNAETNGVFQLESSGIKEVLRKLKPTNIEDVIAVLALYRPGPMEQIDDYVARRHGQDFSYIHPDLEPILKSTYGIIVYQEQIMRIAHEFAGYTLGEADILRRAVSKKKADILLEERKRFVEKCLLKGYKESEGNLIYDYIVKFANYGFNRNHSVPYAIISYQMAYLKAQFKKEFMTVLLSSVIGSERQISQYIQELKRNNIKVIKPNINTSDIDFIIKEDIIYPLTGISNVGYQTAKKIIEEREKGQFKDYSEFKRRTQIASNVLESLINAGALDDFKLTKRQMISEMDINQDELTRYMPGIINKNLEEFPFDELVKREKKALGFNLTISVFNRYEKFMKENGILSIEEASKLAPNSRTKVIGVIKKIKEISTKKGEIMAFLLINDMSTENECVLFPKEYKKLKNFINCDIISVFEISIQTRNGKVQFEIIDLKGV